MLPSSHNYQFGMIDGFIPWALNESLGALSEFPYVLFRSIDSTRDVEELNQYVQRWSLKSIPTSNGPVLELYPLMEQLRDDAISLRGFDEVWCLGELSSDIKLPSDLSLTSDKENFAIEVPSGIEAWLSRMQCGLCLGDGAGLNWGTSVVEIARILKAG